MPNKVRDDALIERDKQAHHEDLTRPSLTAAGGIGHNRGPPLPPPESSPNQRLTRAEAGKYLRDTYRFGSKRTLDYYATMGGGPEYEKAGYRALYTISVLDRWAKSRIGPPQTTTAENVNPTPPPRDGSRPRGRPSNREREALEIGGG